VAGHLQRATDLTTPEDLRAAKFIQQCEVNGSKGPGRGLPGQGRVRVRGEPAIVRLRIQNDGPNTVSFQ